MRSRGGPGATPRYSAAERRILPDGTAAVPGSPAASDPACPRCVSSPSSPCRRPGSCSARLSHCLDALCLLRRCHNDVSFCFCKCYIEEMQGTQVLTIFYLLSCGRASIMLRDTAHIATWPVTAEAS